MIETIIVLFVLNFLSLAGNVYLIFRLQEIQYKFDVAAESYWDDHGRLRGHIH